MTFKELRDKLNELSEYQLLLEVKVWAEDKALSDTSFEIANEDWWCDEDGCFQLCELDESEAAEIVHTARLALPKGTPYIWSDL